MRVEKVFFGLGTIEVLAAVVLFCLDSWVIGFNQLVFGVSMMFAAKFMIEQESIYNRTSTFAEHMKQLAMENGKQAVDYMEKYAEAKQLAEKLVADIDERDEKIARMQETIDGLTNGKSAWMKKIIKQHFENKKN